MKVDMADKEMLESSQSKSEEELREKCGMISDQRAVGTGPPPCSAHIQLHSPPFTRFGNDLLLSYHE